jgi:hypothetical protein
MQANHPVFRPRAERNGLYREVLASMAGSSLELLQHHEYQLCDSEFPEGIAWPEHLSLRSPSGVLLPWSHAKLAASFQAHVFGRQ